MKTKSQIFKLSYEERILKYKKEKVLLSKKDITAVEYLEELAKILERLEI